MKLETLLRALRKCRSIKHDRLADKLEARILKKYTRKRKSVAELREQYGLEAREPNLTEINAGKRFESDLGSHEQVNRYTLLR